MIKYTRDQRRTEETNLEGCELKPMKYRIILTGRNIMVSKLVAGADN